MWTFLAGMAAGTAATTLLLGLLLAAKEPPPPCHTRLAPEVDYQPDDKIAVRIHADSDADAAEKYLLFHRLGFFDLEG